MLSGSSDHFCRICYRPCNFFNQSLLSYSDFIPSNHQKCRISLIRFVRVIKRHSQGVKTTRPAVTRRAKQCHYYNDTYHNSHITHISSTPVQAKLKLFDCTLSLEWLKLKNDKYTCGDAQNKIIQIMALSIPKYIAQNIRNSVYYSIMADRSKAVVLLWFSVACFWCQRFCDVPPYVCSYYFSFVLVAEWPPFGK